MTEPNTGSARTFDSCRPTIGLATASIQHGTDRDAVLLGRDILSEVEMKELLERLRDPANRVSTAVRDAVAYLHRHYRHQITRRQVANAVGMSEDYLSRMFHREFGLPPWTYLTRLRIQQAKIRLRETEDTIQAVARGVGIPDRAYFSRIFRKITGMSPRAYRESADRQNLPRKVRR
jgi:AraC-like DNA-binding protein